MRGATVGRCALLAAVALARAGASPAQSPPVVIAVLPFQDRGSYGQDKEIFRALQLGIPATLGAELARSSGVRLAERVRVNQAVQAQKPGPGRRMDAATAARVGSQAGSRYVITGNFADFYGNFRIDARVIDAESGRILEVVSNNDPALQDRADLSGIIQLLADRILAAVRLAPGTRGPEGRGVPTEALTQFSLGLLHESQGDKRKAAEHYQRALAGFPEYVEAREGMRRVRS